MTHNPKDITFLIGLVEKIKTDPPHRTISGYVEGRRIMPQDAPIPGPWKNDNSPYLTEIMDCLSPSSPVVHVAVMKGAQVGITAAAENEVCYYSDEAPAPIMVMSADDDMVQKWGQLRLEPALRSMGITLAPALEGNKKSRKSGDTASMKLFAGGFIVLASARAASKMRSFSIKILVRDEIDAVPAELTSGEGSWLAVSIERTKAYEGKGKKVLDISTPTTFQNSSINKQFLKGDQRYYYVPCPHCGEKQTLDFGNSKSVHGVKPVYDENGVLDSAYYVCKHCEEHIFNYHKNEMLQKGEWRPTAIAQEKGFRSYHISSLYSLFESFRVIYQKYLDGKEDVTARRAFVNLTLGMPFKEAGQRPNLKKILELTTDSTYKDGTVPQQITFLTMAIDVQTGEKNPRLAVEICGHGKGFKTASVLYTEIPGKVDNPSQGAWKKLKEWINDKERWKFRRKDGVILYPKIAAVDSGEGSTHQAVYNFCSTMPDFFPVKGFGYLKAHKKDADEDGYDPGRVQRFALKKIDTNLSLVKINTTDYKNHIYNNLNIKRPEEGDEIPDGFCDFPMDRGEEYFKMLTAEEKMTDGSFKAFGRRNEALDVRVYNLGISDLYLGRLISAYRDAAIKDGSSIDDAKKDIDHDYIFDAIERKNKPPLTKT
jgi:phage terminase large subunit GpA-like protein